MLYEVKIKSQMLILMHNEIFEKKQKCKSL